MNEYNSPPVRAANALPVAVLARDLRKGDRFLSDRESEGEVKAAYDYGIAPYDDRPESIGVYTYPGRPGDSGFFIAIQPDWLVHLTYKAER